MKNKIENLFKSLPKTLANSGQWLIHGVFKGFGGKRIQRYFWLGTVGITGIWILTTAYLVFTPRTYVSDFTFVLPGSGAGASINLEQIGQASSISQSPFSNQRVNPTESYKRLLLSERIREAAKQKGGFDWLPKPRVKLLDQTQFMEISINGSSPEQARDRAVAYEQAFLAEVNALRSEERRAREIGYREMIDEFEASVSKARAALLEHQSTTGLASLTQFDENVALVDNLNTDLNEARIAETERARRGDALLNALGLNKEDAAEALSLAADPAFVALTSTLAEQEAFLSQTVYKFGEKHPKRIKAEREHQGLTSEIVSRANRFTGIKREKALRYARLLSSPEYSALLKSAIEEQAAFAAASERSSKLAETLEKERNRLKSLSIAAAKLDDLTRAHQVAEAVFRSAMARIDTNKTDLFASYPLIQTVEPPFIPNKPTSPMIMFSLIGAIGATVFYLMGLALACLRLPILNTLSKKN